MKKVDLAILEINEVICENISIFDDSKRGLLSQNILSQLRNFVEAISLKAYSHGRDIEVTHSNIVNAMNFVKSNGNLKFLSKFHKFLQPVASHYTMDKENSERLMLKYYEYLLKIKSYLKKQHNLEVLGNIDDFPIDTDSTTKEYYEKIANKLNQFNLKTSDNERYYIQKIKPFFVDHEVYYEVTFFRANDYTSKTDRIIAFTKYEVLPNYAVKLMLSSNTIHVLDKDMPILIITGWEVSVRPCEINNFADIFGSHPKMQSSNKEYQNLMQFLTRTGLDLVEFLNSDDYYYSTVKTKMTIDVKVTNLFNVLDKCRNLIKRNTASSNILKYLLYKLNNKIIKSQLNSYETCSYLSNLYLNWGCLPFDQMPFNSALINHNPRIYDLFDCIDLNNREHELLARLIENNTVQKGELFTSKEDIKNFNNIDALIKIYNSKIYKKHLHRKIDTYKKFIYIRGYEEDTIEIIKKLKELSVQGLKNYSKSVDSWLENNPNQIDCEDKKKSLRLMFESSKVALIYGSAGTGKSTMINHISNFFNEYSKLYLAYTNPAIDNLKRKVHASNSEFKTISSFIASSRIQTEFDILIIDECSTVSNSDMKKIIEKTSFQLLVLVGDTFQIESINFGNWFNIAQSFIHKSSITELTKPYRSDNEQLLNLWGKVRNIDDDILEQLTKNKYTYTLDSSIFEHFEEDEIILCLNYDGLYGINNINRFLQANNENNYIKWGDHIYKIGDPILFNDTKRFGTAVYNNLKGKIVNIKLFDEKIYFEIEIEKIINEMDAMFNDFELVESENTKKSVIGFFVNKHKSGDEDDDSSDAVVPFQVAYAVSIHKAQGLEYSSVKIVITDEVEEMINHNIFYTAITRAKDKLRIYWSPETENKILNNLKKRDSNKDVYLLKSKYKEVL
ncbi:ATP-dependent DNA helicase [Malaciobacter marinus]|uniref:ATP-dependent DNA helicase n=1 Tax=Malaciobacter marinus TaxID=505249 RepID=UPI003AFF864C